MSEIAEIVKVVNKIIWKIPKKPTNSINELADIIEGELIDLGINNVQWNKEQQEFVVPDSELEAWKQDVLKLLHFATVKDNNFLFGVERSEQILRGLGLHELADQIETRKIGFGLSHKSYSINLSKFMRENKIRY